MRKLTDLLRGYTRLRVTGGAPQWCLNRLTAERIPFWGTEFIDPFTLEVNVYSRDAAAAQNAAQRAMCDAETIAVRGFRSRYYGLLRRPVLLAFTALAILCALIVPNRVWFLCVEGNENIPSEKILRAVRDAGVGIGVYGPNVKPQLIRYRVLNDIPELLWLTVTQNGASAVVTVREKDPKPLGAPRDAMRNMVAIRGGLITDISVLEGNAAVEKGKIVLPGELLISGVIDLGSKFRVCCADGEVFARTWREIGAVTPKSYTRKTPTGRVRHAVFLQIGKKRMKISFGSGFSDATCDKMTETRTLTLPGDLTLPLYWIVETYREYTPSVTETTPEDAAALLRETVERGVRSEMIAGKILSESAHDGEADGVFTLLEKLECEEMIARPVRAELFKGDETND